jgi:CrcB protein
MEAVNNATAIALGAAVGANLRHWVALWGASRGWSDFPWHTLVTNVSGSFLLGVLTAVAAFKGWGPGVRLFLLVGVCGGYTTFSTFSQEFVQSWGMGRYALACVYAISTNAACILACALGGWLGRAIASRP